MCKQKVQALYSTIFDVVVPVSSPKVAEMCKLFENIQRLVNISLVNELNTLCESLGIDFMRHLKRHLQNHLDLPHIGQDQE